MRIAIAGNPNAGKSTLFNALSGSRARVANYPGVTVERKEATCPLPSGAEATLVDLPGAYSLAARSPEEEVAHDAPVGLLGAGRPDVVVAVVDATHLPRGLYLIQQLRELGMPLIVALNMCDVAAERGLAIDHVLLAERLGVPVVPTCARDHDTLGPLLDAIEKGGVRDEAATHNGLGLEARAHELVEELRLELGRGERPDTIGEALWLLTSSPERVRAAVDEQLGATVEARRTALDPEGDGAFTRQVIEARYKLVDALLEGVVDESKSREDTRTARLDRVLLHPVWGWVVFVSITVLLFQAVFAWADPLIGGVELLMELTSDALSAVLPEGLTRSLLVNGLVAGVGNVLVFLPQIGLLFFGLALLEESGYYARAAVLLDRVMRRAGLHGHAFIPLMSSFACAIPGIMSARVIGSSRDRLVTILIAPFMSCSARLPVYLLVAAALFSSAQPIWGFLSIGGLATAAMYLLGFGAAIVTAWMLKRSVLRSPVPPLLIELPPYRRPLLRTVLRQVVERCGIFITQTGPIIVCLSVLLWGLLTFPQHGLEATEIATRTAQIEQTTAAESEDRAEALAQLAREDEAAQLSGSLGGRLGHLIEPAIEPLGFDWRIGVGLVASFAAREVLVSTLAQVYALDADTEADSPSLRQAMLKDLDPATGRPRFTPLVGISLMVFFVLALQCLSTVATVRRETNSWGWAIAQLVYMNVLAYLASLLVYQGGLLLGWGT